MHLSSASPRWWGGGDPGMMWGLCKLCISKFLYFPSIWRSQARNWLQNFILGRISALGLFCTDLAALGPYCQDLGPIFSQYGPCAWLIRYIWLVLAYTTAITKTTIYKNPKDYLLVCIQQYNTFWKTSTFLVTFRLFNLFWTKKSPGNEFGAADCV